MPDNFSYACFRTRYLKPSGAESTKLQGLSDPNRFRERNFPAFSVAPQQEYPGRLAKQQ